MPWKMLFQVCVNYRFGNNSPTGEAVVCYLLVDEASKVAEFVNKNLAKNMLFGDKKNKDKFLERKAEITRSEGNEEFPMNIGGVSVWYTWHYIQEEPDEAALRSLSRLRLKVKTAS